ncbi:MAG: response regulator [Candidatus Cloacimonas sp.]|jgi:DNA-binding response OmpR family regulator|nr:response regulator [Candidatus Cloacimonas sp.]
MKQARILVVDDSIAIVNSLCAILKVSGFEVDSAFNASEALRKIHSKDYDLVICDIEMPGITGLDFLGRVRKDFDRELEVILMTGFLDHDYFIEAIRLGASDFIRKPIDSKQIIRSIQNILERKHKRNDSNEFYKYLDSTEISFALNPANFSKFAISKVFNSLLLQNFHLNRITLNEVLICVDEMIYNAFIHGTLQLTVAERIMDHVSLREIIDSRLQDPKIKAKRLRFSLSIDHLNESITVCVDDDGDGFDYQSWMQRVKLEPKLNLEEHGRGISMLYHLSDSMEFSRGGRMVKITKKLVQEPQE